MAIALRAPAACPTGRRVQGADGGRDGNAGVDLEHAVLHLLDREQAPAGSGTLMEALQDLFEVHPSAGPPGPER